MLLVLLKDPSIVRCNDEVKCNNLRSITSNYSNSFSSKTLLQMITRHVLLSGTFIRSLKGGVNSWGRVGSWPCLRLCQSSPFCGSGEAPAANNTVRPSAKISALGRWVKSYKQEREKNKCISHIFIATVYTGIYNYSQLNEFYLSQDLIGQKTAVPFLYLRAWDRGHMTQVT